MRKIPGIVLFLLSAIITKADIVSQHYLQQYGFATAIIRKVVGLGRSI